MIPASPPRSPTTMQPPRPIPWLPLLLPSSGSSSISANPFAPNASRSPRVSTAIAPCKWLQQFTNPAEREPWCGSDPELFLNRMQVRVPASSANLGPGFDCLGLALGIYLHCRFDTASQLEIRVSGRDADRISTADDNLIWRTAQAV